MPRLPTPDGSGRNRTTYLPNTVDKLFDRKAKELGTTSGKLLRALASALVYGSISDEAVKQELK